MSSSYSAQIYGQVQATQLLETYLAWEVDLDGFDTNILWSSCHIEGQLGKTTAQSTGMTEQRNGSIDFRSVL